MIIGIIGNGFVGKATYQLKCEEINILAYDINPNLCDPIGIQLEQLNQCEIIFISVPTPMAENGSCHLNIIYNVLDQLNFIQYNGFIVLRSTVPPGTSDKINCYFMPEFLTEKNFIDDFINNSDWFFGLLCKPTDDMFKNKITELFNLAYKYNRIKYNVLHFVSNKEAEMIKMFRNCYLATKVSFCNEMYQFCNMKEINYETVRKFAVMDKRIGASHTMVPGHDGRKGFGGTCFPKDTSSLCYSMKETGMVPYIIESVIKRNETIDRPEKDWCQDTGRAVVNMDSTTR
jgi:nucleotide sugar dehydrogenase